MHRYLQSLRQCFQLFLSHLRYTRRSNTARQVDSRSTGFDIFKSSTKLPATTHFLLVAGWNSDTNGIPTQRRVGTRTHVRCCIDVNSLHNQRMRSFHVKVQLVITHYTTHQVARHTVLINPSEYYIWSCHTSRRNMALPNYLYKLFGTSTKRFTAMWQARN